MNCAEFEKQLEALEEYSQAPSEWTAHSAHCSACAELVEDLSTIRAQARQMLSLEQPPQRVWQNIHRELERTGLIRESRHKGWLGQVASFAWFPRLSMGFAYAAVFAMALGVIRVYSIVSQPIASPPLPQPPNPPFAQVFERVPAQQRAVYVSNLDQVDSSIQHLQTFLASHPDDPFAREELFSTYQQKSRLWEDLVRWQDFSEDIP